MTQSSPSDPTISPVDAVKSLFATLLAFAGRRHIDTTASPAQLERLANHVRGVWTSYGRADPFFSVITCERYHTGAISEADIAGFYAGGSIHCQMVLDACRRNGLAPNFSGTVLDFGCGLGRVGEYLSAHFANYIGVDISRPHLDQAAAHFAAIGRTNAAFRLLPDMLEDCEPVDLVFSFLVLQHSPPPVIAMLIERMCQILRPGGILFFQVPVSLTGYRFNLQNYLASPPAHGLMEMHCLPKRDVLRIFAAKGCELLEALPADDIGEIGHSYRFLARKRGL